MDKVKVLIDTDIGDDIDDALALALALNSPELDIVGITTVYGKTDVRARLAAKILEIYGRDDIPVAIGSSKPLVNPEPKYFPRQALAVDKHFFPNIVEENAVDFILETVSKYRELTIIMIGPETNLAKALLMKPKIFNNIKIVMMAGYVSQPFPEYNVKCDPEATSIILSKNFPKILVGLDVTLKCSMNKNMVKEFRRSRHKGVKFLSKLIDIWMSYSNHFPILHDPLAIAVSFDRSIVELKPMYLEVELENPSNRGIIYLVSNREPNIDVSINVDVNRFMNMFRNRVLGKFIEYSH
ncbi:MAG TPA: nucleoside hydrolase [Thermoprotei archaeon]|nr:nucleoside hydrolase [Thermoprotei archaeon]